MKPGGITRIARIDSRLAPYDWAFARDQATRIDAHWTELRRSKPALFDGRVLLAHRVALEGDALVASYFEASYRSFLGWRDFGFPGDPIANCFSMAALRSADGAYMLGEMSPGTANAGKMYFPAGTPEPRDLRPDGWVDLEGSVMRELEEETGITPDEVEVEAGWTIVSMSRHAIACMKGVAARADAAALQARLAASNATQDDPELSRLVAIRGVDDFDPVHMPDFMIRYLSETLA